MHNDETAPAFDPTVVERARSLLDAVPDHVRPYRILERIGGGGMGEVYRAEQRSPIRREVAIKLIKLGMDTKLVIARFEAERQALALMDHPNIAKVLDANARRKTGCPYFVMELVKRRARSPKFCRRPRNLTIKANGWNCSSRVCAGDSTRTPERGDPSRPEAEQRAREHAGRQAAREGDRLRHRQSDEHSTHRQNALHRVQQLHRHAAIHEPRAGRTAAWTSTRAATSTASACCCMNC